MLIVTVCCEEPGYSTTPTINDRVSFLFLISKSKRMGFFLNNTFVPILTKEIKKAPTCGALSTGSKNYFLAARSKEAMISAFAASALSQPSTLTHLPFSRSL